jgi:uncharacterized protein YndB with AHSA1/START domain
MVARVGAPFDFDRTWEFPVPPELLWSVLHRTDRYPTWWSWLRELDADGFEPGSTARCVIQSPLPYALRCTIHVEEMRTPESIVTRVGGDLRGPARLEVRREPGGCSARLAWSLTPGSATLRRLAVVARPAMLWAHDRVVATGVEQFHRRALDPARDMCP